MINYNLKLLLLQAKKLIKSIQSAKVKTLIAIINGIDFLKLLASIKNKLVPLINPYRLRIIKRLLKIPIKTKNVFSIK